MTQKPVVRTKYKAVLGDSYYSLRYMFEFLLRERQRTPPPTQIG